MPLGPAPAREGIVQPDPDNKKDNLITGFWVKWFSQITKLLQAFEQGDIYQNANYFPNSTTIDIDPSIFFNLIDTTAGNVQVFLPEPDDAQAIGRTICIKRNTAGANSLTIMDIERGNNVNLTTQDFYVQLYSNGADWWIIAERRGVFP